MFNLTCRIFHRVRPPIPSQRSACGQLQQSALNLLERRRVEHGCCLTDLTNWNQTIFHSLHYEFHLRALMRSAQIPFKRTLL